jgi:hypothetical protein
MAVTRWSQLLSPLPCAASCAARTLGQAHGDLRQEFPPRAACCTNVSGNLRLCVTSARLSHWVIVSQWQHSLHVRLLGLCHAKLGGEFETAGTLIGLDHEGWNTGIDSVVTLTALFVEAMRWLCTQTAVVVWRLRALCSSGLGVRHKGSQRVQHGCARCRSLCFALSTVAEVSLRLASRLVCCTTM